MRTKRPQTIHSFAANLLPVVLAAWLLTSGCAGARHEAGRQLEEDGEKSAGSLPAFPPQQLEAETPGEILSARATPPESQQNAPAQNEAGKNKRIGDALPTLQYQPFSETEIEERMLFPLTLEDCIRIALHQNFRLRLAKHELTRAEASLSGTYGKFLPVFALTGAQENTQQKRPFDPLAPNDPRHLNFYNNSVVGEVQQTLATGAVLNIAGDLRRDLYTPDRFGAPPTKTQNLNFSLRLTQPLMRGAWPAVARSPISLARHERNMRDEEIINTKLTTIFAVKRAYYNLLLAHEVIKINRLALQRDSTLVRVSESMVQAKRATQRDVLSAQIRVADDRAALIRSETDYQLALDALKETIGAPLELPLAVAEAELEFTPVVLDEEELIRLASTNNPALHSASIAIDRALLAHKVARNALLPQLDVTVGYSGQFETTIAQNKDLETAGLLAEFTLSYPFLNREAAADAENAQIAISQEQDRRTNLQRQIVLNIRSIVHNVQSTTEELNALQGTINASKQKVDFSSTMFNLGRASNLDITDAQEAMIKAQNQYLDKLVDYHTQLALLESLIGQPLSQ